MYETILSTSLTSLTFKSDGRFWEFTSDLSKGDTAYTTLALGAHTDNTYFVRSLHGYSSTILSLFPSDGPMWFATSPSSFSYGRYWRCHVTR